MTIIMGICHYTLSKFLVQLDLTVSKGSALITSDADKWDRRMHAKVVQKLCTFLFFFSVCEPYIALKKYCL